MQYPLQYIIQLPLSERLLLVERILYELEQKSSATAVNTEASLLRKSNSYQKAGLSDNDAVAMADQPQEHDRRLFKDIEEQD
ncbi:hypothetical protein [Rurimicrobium arvi]|uniref:Uncharacterized protein n=1 Tax=Rurimicrobium arvi TaxID=2049916 RepID=A0ABP8MEU8_9BACT